MYTPDVGHIFGGHCGCCLVSTTINTSGLPAVGAVWIFEATEWVKILFERPDFLDKIFQLAK